MARIDGTGRNDNLDGTGNDDVIYGYAGSDLLSGGFNDDKLYGGEGNDALYGGKGRDSLFGGEGDDGMWGGAGNDVLVGGEGDDYYNGGDGADRFVFSNVPPTRLGTAKEFVADWTVADVLDFSAIDANWNQAGDQAFRWLGQGDFTGRGGEMVYRFLGEGVDSFTRIYLDVDGDASADMIVDLNGVHHQLNPSIGEVIL